MANGPIPSVVAMLVCDQVLTEAGTNKKSLIGIFEQFNSLSFPARLPRLAIYVKMADADGDYEFKLRIVKLKDEALVTEIKMQTKIPNSDLYTELGLNLVNAVEFPEPGKYELQLYANDIYLHRVTMRAERPPIPLAGGSQWQPKMQ